MAHTHSRSLSLSLSLCRTHGLPRSLPLYAAGEKTQWMPFFFALRQCAAFQRCKPFWQAKSGLNPLLNFFSSCQPRGLPRHLHLLSRSCMQLELLAKSLLSVHVSLSPFLSFPSAVALLFPSAFPLGVKSALLSHGFVRWLSSWRWLCTAH